MTAGLANLAWGIVGDRVVAHGGGRRALILIGLAGTLCSYVMLALASSPSALLAVQKDLWHNAWSLVLVIGLLAAEWIVRRRWGLR